MIQWLILSVWMEAVGTLHRLSYNGGALLAEVGSVVVALPPEMADELRPLIGQKIGILRCDGGYRVRVCG